MMVDLVVFLLIVAVVILLFRRGRARGIGRGFRSGIREFRRGRAGLPPADPELRRDRSPADDDSHT
jgi:Sec-independent protein translocase protein TatA